MYDSHAGSACSSAKVPGGATTAAGLAALPAAPARRLPGCPALGRSRSSRICAPSLSAGSPLLLAALEGGKVFARPPFAVGGRTGNEHIAIYPQRDRLERDQLPAFTAVVIQQGDQSFGGELGEASGRPFAFEVRALLGGVRRQALNAVFPALHRLGRQLIAVGWLDVLVVTHCRLLG